MSNYPVIKGAMGDFEQRRLLGQFVRQHRERLTQDAGAGRRRTPGLRREELAARAGISPTWCAWIEQGRDVQASAAALARLASALRLTRAERAYLFELAARRDPDAPAAETPAAAPAGLAAVVAGLAIPAYGLDRAWRPCCWNPTAGRLFHGWLDRDPPQSLLQFVFLAPSARSLIPDWEGRARRLLSEFRADFSRAHGDSALRGLIESLQSESALFRAAWSEQDVAEREGGRRVFSHPEDGRLAFEQHTFTLAERTDFKLVVLQPVAG